MIALANPNPIERSEEQTSSWRCCPRSSTMHLLRFEDWIPKRRKMHLAEVVARCFVAYVGLVELGKEDIVYPTVLALYAIRQYRDGRRIGTKACSRDAYARRDGVRVEHLGTPYDQRWREQLDR